MTGAKRAERALGDKAVSGRIQFVITAMQRAPRDLSISSGSNGQEGAASKCFDTFLVQVNLDLQALHTNPCMRERERQRSIAEPLQSAHCVFYVLQTKTSPRSRASDGLLAKATAVGYFSQMANYLKDTYPGSLSKSKRVEATRGAMAKAVDERNLLANI